MSWVKKKPSKWSNTTIRILSGVNSRTVCSPKSITLISSRNSNASCSPRNKEMNRLKYILYRWLWYRTGWDRKCVFFGKQREGSDILQSAFTLYPNLFRVIYQSWWYFCPNLTKKIIMMFLTTNWTVKYYVGGFGKNCFSMIEL